MSSAHGASGAGRAGDAAADDESADDRLERWLAEAIELAERGEEIDFDRLCGSQPERIPELRAALEQVGALPRLHAAGQAFDPMIGRVVQARYRVDSRLGAGAMGAVYAAVDDSLGREVAIKVLRPEFTPGASLEGRLVREAEALAKIRHPSVVTVFDCGRSEDGQLFFAMERLRGRSVSELLQAASQARNGGEVVAAYRAALGDAAVRDDSDVRQAVRWVIDAASGLQAAHDSGIVHRDVKPSNLFVETTGRVVLLDFGIVSLGADVTLRDGESASALGTPAYMAPEQIETDAEPGVAADIYALAATLYHLVTCRPPFEGNAAQVLAARRRRDPEPADRRRPALPKDLLAVIERGMARAPGDRYPTAAALRSDLMAWLDYRPVSARRVTPIGRVWRVAKRSPVVRTLAVAGLVAGLLFVWSMLQAAQLERRLKAWREHFAHVPPSLVVAPASLRASSRVTTSSVVGSVLQRLVENAEQPGIGRALQVLWWVDQAQHERAAHGLRSLEGAPFARWLAGELEAGVVPDTQRITAAPAPSSAVDRVLAVLFSMRPTDSKAADVLQRFAPAEIPCRGAAELDLVIRYLTVLEGGSEPADRLARYRDLDRRAAEVSVLHGDSAIARFVRGSALQLQRRSSEAADALWRAAELAPECPNVRINASSAALSLFRLEDARAIAELALGYQPRSLQARKNLIKALMYSAAFDEALERVEELAEFGGSPALVQRMRGWVLLEQAGRAAVAERTDPSRAKISEKLARSARQALSGGALRDAAIARLVCEILLNDESDRRPSLIERMHGDPTHPLYLRALAACLLDRPKLDSSEIRLLASLLQRQAGVLLADDG